MVTRRRSQAGFTLLEVMMALTVLAIGMLGIVALQASTIGTTQDANMFAVGNTVARTWVQRLQRDAQRWNHPSTYVTSSDIGDTAWLKKVAMTAGSTTDWFLPLPDAALEKGASPAFDRMGNDIDMTDPDGLANAVYCTHVRLRTLYPNELIQAEVRVFWKKRRMADPAKYKLSGIGPTGFCAPTVSVPIIGQDDANFHWTYAVSGITKARAQ